VNRAGNVLYALVVALLVCGACSPMHRGATVAPATGAAATPRLYVAIGASETRGQGTDNPLRQAWPQDVFRALPANYSLINLGVPGATVADALADEVPFAERLHPALVTVWLNVNDLLSLVPPDRYATQLGELIGRLRSTGATVLVANTPPLDRLPAYLACEDPSAHPGVCSDAVPRPVPAPQVVDAAVDAYNVAIAAVVAQHGARLVDLHAAGLAARARGQESSLVSADGFHPNAAGAQLVADQFAAGLRAARVLP
jgi:lysophospholipase L1-like esterase